MMIIVKVARDARSGRFTTFENARLHPGTTVVERVRRPSKRRR